MRLKTLNLQGFKTFAPKTDLVFGEGLSAVVGPNGSGKSNIADSIRWVLGEQSLSHLRAKKTEDLIFAGSSNRAPLGMAEVSITLDNSDHLLPLDFSEVTLTRRAYRSGENEYYINKSRVRLRDITELASTLGQAYTVVGQGLIDAALSLRPEERRELFEEAATIRGYFVQREDALRRLNKTEENIARVNDLAVEIEPQVKRLERQARQAQDYGKLEAELHTLLKEWFRGRWLLGTDALKRATQAEEEAIKRVETRKAEVSLLGERLHEARAAVRARLELVSCIHEQRAQVQSRHAAKSQSLAVLSERLNSEVARRATLLREREEAEEAASTLRCQLTKVEDEGQQASRELVSLRQAGKVVTSNLSALDDKIFALKKGRDETQSEMRGLESKQRELADKLDAARRQLSEQTDTIRREEQQVAALEGKLASQQEDFAHHDTLLAEARSAVDVCERAHNEVSTNLASARMLLSEAEARQREFGRKADMLSSQLAAIAGEQQAGLYGGVRAVVAAAKRKELSGYLGTVAELLQVPADLETAVESALGGRLQEVAMQTWNDAERAISMLKEKGAGRATFLPLDTLRATRSPAPPTGPGIVGLARDLVEFHPSLGNLAESLLGRLLIVEDLPSARRTIASLPAAAPWTLSTLGGEVVRPGGSVTGGSNSRAEDSRAKGRTILALERRRREMLEAQEMQNAAIKVADATLEDALRNVHNYEVELNRRAAEVEEARKRAISQQAAHLEKQNLQTQLRQELSWRMGLVTDAKSKAASLVKLQGDLEEQRAKIKIETGPIQLRLVETERDIARIVGEREQAARSAGQEQTRLAVITEALRNFETSTADLRVRLSQQEKRCLNLGKEVTTSIAAEEALGTQVSEQTKELERLSLELREIEAQVDPSEGEARALEEAVARIESDQSAMQSSLLEYETAHSRAAVEHQRCIDTLESLQREMGEELGGVETVEEVVERLGLASDPGNRESQGLQDYEVGSPQMNAERERRVYALKGKLSRIGPVNPLAVEEHAELSSRHLYLQAQLKDLMAASESLRRVISELDRAMREQFAATFVQVNDAFQHFFQTLFGGGTAQLELTNPHDVSASGVEISAQPPGKRMQPLAALSGGERALTSAALLFALLKVRPVPFCVLDEVDAALDESNVTRFRSALQELGKQTQFVLITHNRGTIEAADTLYGVSMAGDGTSQLLSLKVGA